MLTHPSKDGRYEISVCGLDLMLRPVRIDDETPTGMQIAEVAGFAPTPQITVLQWLAHGLEDVRPTETVSICGFDPAQRNPEDLTARFSFDHSYQLAKDFFALNISKRVTVISEVTELYHFRILVHFVNLTRFHIEVKQKVKADVGAKDSREI